ncbi:MAG: thioesterase, partial [Pseudomonadales bacterium]|nr:thioesterase [Pseudomonadales bacterium]
MSLSEQQVQQIITRSHETGDYSALVELIPYARMIGMQVTRLGNEAFFTLPRQDINIGNPVLP